MDSKHSHIPVSTRARCPVCREPVYSRAGIHPQCAVRQSDPPRPKGGAAKVAGPAQPVAIADPGPVEGEPTVPALAAP